MNNRAGSALVMTLLVVGTLVGLTVAFSEDTGVEVSLAGYGKDSFRAQLAARSAVELARAVLAEDEDRAVDSRLEDWAKIPADLIPEEMDEDVEIDGSLTDENSKFNINGALSAEGEILPEKEAQLRRLVLALGLEEEIVEPLLDWLDKDDIERLNGAENGYYRTLAEPYECGNGPFLTLGQLNRVKGFPGGLADYLTLHSDGKININTAPAPVLRSLAESVDEALAEAIVAYREEQDFQTVEDLARVSGAGMDLVDELRSRLTIKSGAFTIAVEGNCGGVVSRIVAVLERGETEGDAPTPIYWKVD